MVERRKTRQRSAIAHALAGNPDFVTAQQLHAQIQLDNPVGLATVYRALQQMSKDHEIDTVTNADGETMFRSCNEPQHHHHLVCRRCANTVELVAPEIETWAHGIADQHGFTAVDHTVEIFGLCAECSAEPSTPTP